MTTDTDPKTNWLRIITWGSVLLLIILLPFLINDPVCFYTYLNTKTLKTESFVRVGFLTFRKKDDPAAFLNECREYLRPSEMVQQERLPEYWILIRKQSTLLVAPQGGKYPVKLRNFLMEHYQEMKDPDYKETEEEFSARFTDFILSLNEDEKFNGTLLPADTDLREKSRTF